MKRVLCHLTTALVAAAAAASLTACSSGDGLAAVEESGEVTGSSGDDDDVAVVIGRLDEEQSGEDTQPSDATANDGGWDEAQPETADGSTGDAADGETTPDPSSTGDAADGETTPDPSSTGDAGGETTPDPSSTGDAGGETTSDPTSTEDGKVVDQGDTDATAKVEPGTLPAEPLPDPALVGCGLDDYLDAAWRTTESGHFRFHYLEGSPAQRDLAVVADERERAYEDIRLALGVAAEPIMDVYLSPNRVAATAHGLAAGRAYAGYDWCEVIYNGVPGSYETVHFGHELTHLLAYHADPEQPTHLAVLDEGLAEYLDQSSRDLHQAYADQLTATMESRNNIAFFDASDVWGENYGRAGSLVQALVTRYGMNGFLAVWRATALTWEAGCYMHDAVGCVDSPGAIEALLAWAVVNVTGESWDMMQLEWEYEVRLAMARGPTALADEDLRAVQHLVDVTDRAINQDDPQLYRATMDGFYCVWSGDTERADIARRTVGAFDDVDSEILAVYPTGTRNFPSAYALVARREARGALAVHGLFLEKFAEGWRVTYGPDWY